MKSYILLPWYQGKKKNTLSTRPREPCAEGSLLDGELVCAPASARRAAGGCSLSVSVPMTFPMCRVAGLLYGMHATADEFDDSWHPADAGAGGRWLTSCSCPLT